MNKTINEVVVVEGYHDLAKLKSIYPNMDVMITNGSEISETTLKELKMLNESKGLILFLDPDYQGERIRRIVNDYVGPTKHAFLPKHQCISKNKKKVGIEHASSKNIIDAFSKLKLSKVVISKKITQKDLNDLNLVGKANSKKLREKLCEELGIGLSNGKTLLKKLNIFNINIDDIKKILDR